MKIFTKIIIVIIILLGLLGCICLVKNIIYQKKYVNIVSTMSDKYEIDENLIYAVIKTESNFDENAISKANAKGLMQIVDDTAIEISKKIGIDNFNVDMLYNPEINIEIGTYYMKELYDKYQNRIIAIIAYNAGQGNVDKWLEEGIITKDNNTFSNIPYKETATYWKKVLREYNIYNTLYKNE